MYGAQITGATSENVGPGVSVLQFPLTGVIHDSEALGELGEEGAAEGPAILVVVTEDFTVGHSESPGSAHCPSAVILFFSRPKVVRPSLEAKGSDLKVLSTLQQGVSPSPLEKMRMMTWTRKRSA